MFEVIYGVGIALQLYRALEMELGLEYNHVIILPLAQF